ncbi:MAG: decaprenyl-phosphate phosphoribosyltransferase [Candidatus Goldiibacteriota bacterium]|jgi:4-hydroxybenzoate polyprenyltransferase
MKKQASIISDLLRVKQWPKNMLIFGALVFTGNLFNLPFFLKVLLGFFLLSFASSSLYIFNDINDYKEDRLHPEKKFRPIASGAVKKDFAYSLSAILMLVSLTCSFFLSKPFFIITLIYAVMTVLYTLKLKHMVILDVFEISTGFVIRAAAGALIISVTISPWLLICTTLLALFVALSKRRHELSLPDAQKHRKILQEYSIPLLDQMISVVTASTVVAYTLYTFTSQTAEKHNYLMFTVPFVLYGIFRYLYLVHKKNLGGSPETVFLKDIPMIVNIVLYIISSIIIVYFIK